MIRWTLTNKNKELMMEREGIFLLLSLNRFSRFDKMSFSIVKLPGGQQNRLMAVCCWVAVRPHPPPSLPTPGLSFVPPNIPSSVTFPAAGLVCSLVVARPFPGWKCVEVCAMLVAAMMDRRQGRRGVQGGGADRRGDDGSEGVDLPPHTVFTSPSSVTRQNSGALSRCSDIEFM